jgi:hypothetical protein
VNFSIFNSELRPRTWFRLALVGVGAVVASLISINVVIDPYDYFHLSPLAAEVQTNERVWKIDYLAKHRDEFDAYILGSSIASQIDPGLAGELTGDRFYNLTMSGGNAYDFRLYLEYMIRNGYPIKRLLVIYDLALFWNYGESGREYERLHPRVSGDSTIEFYASYLTRIHFWGTLDKLRANLGKIDDYPHNSYDRTTGVYSYVHRNALIEQDHEAFIAGSNTLNENFLLRKKKSREIFSDCVEDTRRFIELAREHDIEVTFIVPLHNYNYMNRIVFDDYADYLRALAGLTGFWDFSGYDDVNMDNHQFYDSMHFRPPVGDRILRRVYSTAGDDQAFGRWVTQDNIEEHLVEQREEFAFADRTFQTFAEKNAP